MIHKAVDEYGKACDDPNKNAQEYYDGIVGYSGVFAAYVEQVLNEERENLEKL